MFKIVCNIYLKVYLLLFFTRYRGTSGKKNVRSALMVSYKTGLKATGRFSLASCCSTNSKLFFLDHSALEPHTFHNFQFSIFQNSSQLIHSYLLWNSLYGSSAPSSVISSLAHLTFRRFSVICISVVCSCFFGMVCERCRRTTSPYPMDFDRMLAICFVALVVSFLQVADGKLSKWTLFPTVYIQVFWIKT